jgi:small subunit ribosomal protein S12e
LPLVEASPWKKPANEGGLLLFVHRAQPPPTLYALSTSAHSFPLSPLPPPKKKTRNSDETKSNAGSEAGSEVAPGSDAGSAGAAAAGATPAEGMDVNQAIAAVLAKALAHDGLSRGLNEAARALERGSAQLAVLADDCDQPDIKKLVEALCAEHNVSLLSVPESKQLGQWAGLCKLDAEGEPRKVVGCSCAVVTDYGDESEGLTVLQEYLKNR